MGFSIITLLSPIATFCKKQRFSGVTGFWNRCFAQPYVITDYEILFSGIHQ